MKNDRNFGAYYRFGETQAVMDETAQVCAAAFEVFKAARAEQGEYFQCEYWKCVSAVEDYLRARAHKYTWHIEHEYAFSTPGCPLVAVIFYARPVAAVYYGQRGWIRLPTSAEAP